MVFERVCNTDRVLQSLPLAQKALVGRVAGAGSTMTGGPMTGDWTPMPGTK